MPTEIKSQIGLSSLKQPLNKSARTQWEPWFFKTKGDISGKGCRQVSLRYCSEKGLVPHREQKWLKLKIFCNKKKMRIAFVSSKNETDFRNISHNGNSEILFWKTFNKAFCFNCLNEGLKLMRKVMAQRSACHTMITLVNIALVISLFLIWLWSRSR